MLVVVCIVGVFGGKVEVEFDNNVCQIFVERRMVCLSECVVVDVFCFEEYLIELCGLKDLFRLEEVWSLF